LWAIIRYGCASSQDGNVFVLKHERHRGLRARVRQVGEVAQDLRAREHALVDDRAAAEGRDDELGAGGDLRHAADHVQLALEGVLIGGQLVGRGDDEVLDVRRVQVGRDADVVLVDRDVAPAHDALALGRHRVLEELLELGAALLVARQEAHADAVGAGRRQVGVDDPPDELIRHLEQDSSAVTRIGICTRGTAVLEVLERDDGSLYGLVRRLAVELGDHRDATGVVLVGRIVEADRATWTLRHRRATGGGTRCPIRGLGRERKR
jgi:hypothetical protein